MKLTVLGSCSGTEPMPGRHHASILLTAENRQYLFDAGDDCAYSAHLLGCDLTKLNAVFISHPHFDHIGGLPLLFYTVKKLLWVRKETDDFPLPVYCSSPERVEAALMLSSKKTAKKLDIHTVTDGVLFDDGVLKVEAMHNGHMRETEPPFHSFSYLLSLEGKKVLYSGDVLNVRELGPWLDCDLMMMENGHHDPIEVTQYLATQEKKPRQFVFVHHGRAMLSDPEGYKTKCRSIYGDNLDVAFDGMEISL